MSGGHFDYRDDYLADIVLTLEEDIRDIDKNENVEHKDNTKKFMELTHDVTLLSMKMLHRVDWFLSGDDGDKDMIERFFDDMYFCRSLFFTPSLPDLTDDIGKLHDDLIQNTQKGEE